MNQNLIVVMFIKINDTSDVEDLLLRIMFIFKLERMNFLPVTYFAIPTTRLLRYNSRLIADLK